MRDFWLKCLFFVTSRKFAFNIQQIQLQENLKPKFSFVFNGYIWRILADAHQNQLVAEIRDGESRHLSFAAVDLTDNRLLWQDLSLPEAWWVSPILLHGQVLLLQMYPNSQLPEPQGLLAINVQTAQKCWQNDQLRFVKLTETGIIGYEFQQDQLTFYRLDLQNGSVLENLPSEQIPDLRSPVDSGVTNPLHYTPDNPHFSELQSFLKKKLQIDAVKAVDYAEHPRAIIISYYIYQENIYTNFLLVTDLQGTVLLHETLATGLAGTGADTFILVNNHLIFSKDKRQLISYEI
jgi:hypothetical protein